MGANKRKEDEIVIFYDSNNGSKGVEDYLRAQSQGIQGITGTQGTTGTQGIQGSTGPSTTINATNTTDNTTFYPVFVAAAGSNQTASVRTTATAFTFNASTGDLTATGNVIAYSDVSIKDDIEVIENAIEKLNKIRGVTFVRKDLADKEKRHAGVIAQEIEQVLPEVVGQSEDGIKTVSYGNIVALLIEAIKEQQKQIDELKKKVV